MPRYVLAPVALLTALALTLAGLMFVPAAPAAHHTAAFLVAWLSYPRG